MTEQQKLGDSIFNYTDYTVFRFIHYFQQIQFILCLKPKRMLEIGPGDYTVTDFLRRKGFAVDTLDNDPLLRPDYLGDIRQPLQVKQTYDLIVAAEVFEHMNFKWLPTVLENLKAVLEPGGHLLVSVPYSNIRFLPARPDYGKFLSCEGRIMTGLPWYALNFFQNPLRVVSRFMRGWGWKRAFKLDSLPVFPDDKYDVHHWDVGFFPTRASVVRRVMAEHFTLVQEKCYLDTNCVFYLLRKEGNHAKRTRN